MDNHYHFLLRQDGDIEISKFMQAVFNVYTKVRTDSASLIQGNIESTANEA